MGEFDVIVIGAGAAGSATALELARRGKNVLLLEQFSVPHERGSSHGHSRIFRFAYDDAYYARLAMRSLQTWRELEAESNERLLTMTGGLDLGPSGCRSLERTAITLTEVGAAFERLDALELQRRFPVWRVPDDWVALYSQDAGILEPSRAVEVMVALARAHGATLLEHTMVESLDLERSVVRTDKGVFTASQIVVAAGGWLPELFPQWKSSLEVTCESVMYFAPKSLESFLPERFPLFIEHETLAYGFPAFGLPGVKMGLHQSGSAITPGTTASTRSLEVAPEAIERVKTWFDSRLPGQDWRLIQARTCLYTNTPSHDFLIDAHPDAPNVLIVSPCSGHGFKFSAYLGVVVADRLEGVENELAGSRFTFESVARPGTGALLARASVEKA
jgi:sarcosine oxidase